LAGRIRLHIDHPSLGRLILREPGPGDRWRILEFFEGLSRESIYNRFFRLVKSFYEVVDRVLSGREAIVCLLVEYEDRVIACGEVYRTSMPHVGEPAVAVLDEYQGMGLGTLLVMALACASLGRGVWVFRAYTFYENKPILRIMRRLRARLIEDLEDAGLYEMNLREALGEVRRALESYGVDPSSLGC